MVFAVEPLIWIEDVRGGGSSWKKGVDHREQAACRVASRVLSETDAFNGTKSLKIVVR